MEPPIADAPCWIGSSHPFDLHEAYLNFRRVFDIEAPPARALLTVTADSRYKLWVNGAFVARGPARCYPQFQSVDEFDVTAHLRPGNNVLAVQVYQPGYSHFAYVHRATAGLLAKLTLQNGTVIVTDTKWRVKRDDSFDPLVPRVSIYGSGVEARDLARDEDWPSPGYDDSGWESARLVAPLGGYPWTGTQARELPYLIERGVPMMLLETMIGPAGPEADAHLALRSGWAGAQPKHFPPDEQDWFSLSLKEGESAYWLYDLGRDHIGQGWAEIEGAVGGESLSISYHEKIRDGKLVISDPHTYCRVRLTDSFRLRAGSQVAETFSLRGGRYLVFQLTGPTQGIRVRWHMRSSEYPLNVTRPLELADPELAAIVTLCEDTMRACLQDAFIDSTWRESSQWTGDALPHALILYAMSGDVGPLRRVIEMAAQDPYPDGILPSVLPAEAHAYAVVDYNFMWVELLHLHHGLVADTEFLRAMWHTLERMIDRFDMDRNADGLVTSPSGRRLFLDWSAQSRAEPSAVYNLHYLLALQRADELACVLGELEAHERWSTRARALTSAARAKFWRGGHWRDDPAGSTFSQLAAALAVLTGASTDEEASGLLGAIAARSLDEDDAPTRHKMTLASPFMHHYLFEALRYGDRNDVVVEIIRRRWGRWTRAGYPTTWENWNVDFPDGSQCHAFSAHPRWHLAVCAENQSGRPPR